MDVAVGPILHQQLNGVHPDQTAFHESELEAEHEDWKLAIALEARLALVLQETSTFQFQNVPPSKRSQQMLTTTPAPRA